jgi:ketosteroid isomerase-like protein
MSRQDVEMVAALFKSAGEGDEVDMAAALDDEDWLALAAETIDPAVEVRFEVPEASGIEVMQRSDFSGVDGLVEGWRMWLGPWEQFRIRLQETVDAGDGVVLLIARATGRLRGSDVEIPQEAASVHRVQEGRIVSMGFYLDVEQAREAAGLA